MVSKNEGLHDSSKRRIDEHYGSKLGRRQKFPETSCIHIHVY